MMTKWGKSVFFFGAYVILLGCLFVLIPKKIVSFAGLPALPMGWAQIIGFLALIVGCCDVVCGRNNVHIFCRASVWIRLCFAAAIGWLVVSEEMPPVALLFGGVDAVGALWTAIALKQEKDAKSIFGSRPKRAESNGDQ